ncbi:cystathionine gamma-synthase family protein [Carboxylicivirga sp. M1479]|uniref:cystathionine gamma-synthase family protein n=1 Tax=Carboxylicivirga sp. M1479 TaxID=2594476 RepID=UPI001178C0D7|nr:cystathionine gamma-synthase family protein [Carboxylicivirga sp. M1479]TRX71967.1 cystathionine gamma-synthase family protein [Carboxylicivirga sp. M1479]
MDKKMKPESLMMSHAYDAHEHQGAVKCPIYQTSTFAFNNCEEGKAYFELAYGLREANEGEEMGMIYSRLNHPNMDILEKRLALWDEAEAGAFFSSGMAAISTTILSFVKPGDVLLFSHPVYGGTDHFIHHVLPQFNIGAVGFVKGEKEDVIIERVEKAYPGRKPSMVYVETPGNPTNSIIDIEMVSRVAKYFSTNEKKCVLAVDNTFLGPVFQHPMEFGADLVVYSATKFIGGHSDVIAGAITGSADLVMQVKVMRTFFGSQLDPNSSWLLQRSLETIKVRMEAQAKTAKVVAEHLKDHPMVDQIHYLGMLEEGSEMKEIFERQCLSAGSMIAFDIVGGEKEAFMFLDNLKLFKLAVSLGSTESLAEHPATMTHVDVAPEDRLKLGISPSLVRLSIGLEDSQDLIDQIEKAFEVVKKANSSAMC